MIYLDLYSLGKTKLLWLDVNIPCEEQTACDSGTMFQGKLIGVTSVNPHHNSVVARLRRHELEF